MWQGKMRSPHNYKKSVWYLRKWGLSVLCIRETTDPLKAFTFYYTKLLPLSIVGSTSSNREIVHIRPTLLEITMRNFGQRVYEITRAGTRMRWVRHAAQVQNLRGCQKLRNWKQSHSNAIFLKIKISAKTPWWT